MIGQLNLTPGEYYALRRMLDVAAGILISYEENLQPANPNLWRSGQLIALGDDLGRRMRWEDHS